MPRPTYDTILLSEIHKRCGTDNTILNYSCFQMENSNSFLFILWIKRHIKWFNAFSDKVYSVCLWENFFPCYMCYRYENKHELVHINYTILCYKTPNGILHFVALKRINAKAFKMWYSFRLTVFLGISLWPCSHSDETGTEITGYCLLLLLFFLYFIHFLLIRYIIRNKDSF